MGDVKCKDLTPVHMLAPAKVNLFLRVLRKRADGYHDLHTLFERVDLCDEIVFKQIPAGICIRSDQKSLPTGPKNLVYQAAKLLKDKYAVKSGVSIYIRKRIPVRAGLGGGSSDAAAVLLGLNKLWKLSLSKNKLCKLGAKIGSDVPFFILETPFAEGRGRGEILTPLRMKRVKFWHVIVKPPFGISTEQAYQTVTLTPPNTDARMLLRALKKGHAGRLQELLSNSLEVTGNKQLKVIFKLKNELLEQGALASLMSGSGSAVFGIFKNRRTAEVAARTLRKNKCHQVFVASTF